MSSKPPEVDGVSFTPEAIEDIRGVVIELRDEALKQREFDYAVALSHAIAMLARLKHYEESFQHA